MTTSNKELTISEKDLSLVEDNILNSKQLGHLLKKTPSKYVKNRPAKGGGTWSYVSGGYVKKVLNLMFGWDWDFEIIDNTIAHGEVVVKGKLTCRVGSRTIVKMQYGNKDIVFKRGTKDPLSIGNDMKAAATDALKKCAAEIGIASDIYNAEEFREVVVKQDSTDEETSRVISFLEKVKSIDELDILEDSLSGQTLTDEAQKAIEEKRHSLTSK